MLEAMNERFTPKDFDGVLDAAMQVKWLRRMVVTVLEDGEDEPLEGHLKVWVLGGHGSSDEKHPTLLRLRFPQGENVQGALQVLVNLTGHNQMHDPKGTLVLTFEHPTLKMHPDLKQRFPLQFHPTFGLSAMWNRDVFVSLTGIAVPELHELQKEVHRKAHDLSMQDFMARKTEEYGRHGLDALMVQFRRRHVELLEKKDPVLRRTFLPVHEAHKLARKVPFSGEVRQMLVSETLAMTAWLTRKSVYRFDGDFRGLLHESDFDDQITAEDFLHPPEFCFILEDRRGLLGTLALLGCLVYFAWDDKEGLQLNLHYLMHTDGKVLFSTHLLPLKGNLRETLLKDQQFQHEVLKQVHQVDAAVDAVADLQGRMIRNTLLEVLYLCSKKPDASLPQDSLVQVRNILGKRKIVDANEVQNWPVGERIGQAFRASKARVEGGRGGGAPSGVTRVPHPRRSHFRHSRVGKRDGPGDYVLHWIPPVVVNEHLLKEDRSDLPTTVHPVKEV